MAKTVRSSSKDPAAKLSILVESARKAWIRLEADPSDTAARSDYNFAVGRIIETLESSDREPWKTPISLGSAGELTADVPELPSAFSIDDVEIAPVDRYHFRGTHVQNRATRDGVGAPIVVILREGDGSPAEGDLFHGMTAFLRFEGTRAHLEILDPLDIDSVTLVDHRFDLAADFTASMALRMGEVNVRRDQLARFLHPARFADSARLARIQPYDPDRIPVLFIHGLGNSPATFVPLVSELRKDPAIRKRYQFWYFSHPSGIPYSVSAASLRKQLDEMHEEFPGTHDMVVIGHSMGGMMSRLLITEPGTALWDAFFDSSPEDLPVSEETRNAVSDVLLFEPRPDIARLILVSASLRGSDDATSFMGRLGANFIGDPFPNDTVADELRAYRRADEDFRRDERLPNSVDILDPDSFWLQVVNGLPLDRSIPFHSLIGDQGRGGNLDQTPPQSSDGIVPYWSAHLEGAESETIVPSGHWSHLHPEGMAEIRRILHLHLEQQN